ncbi:MAG: tetratricopeptide repeat protein [Deltaproteobacteria bacterium]|nr:MAG: tetratricopeptide repeat protein [Deltaproteobacteria bacterium]
MAEEGKEKVFTLSPEIEKYIEILGKDPKSRVFAPLAEAYRKGGLLDEAIHVAQDGLKFNPNYVSGIMALGRAYYDKGMKAEARVELEKVVKAASDNIMAHKILGEIYQAEGKNEEAVKSFKIVLALSPGDNEVSEALDILEGRKPAPSVPEEPVKAPPVEEKEEVKAEPEKTVPEVAETPVETPQAEAEASPPEQIEKVEPLPISEEEVSSTAPGEAEVGQEESEGIKEFDEAFGKFEEIPPETSVKEVEMREEAEPFPAGEPEVLGPEADSEIPRGEPLEQPPVSTPEPEVKMETGMEPPLGEQDIAGEEEAYRVEPEAGGEEIDTATMAELYIEQGYPEKALNVYQKILASDPDNLEIKKKIEELSGQIKPPPPPEDHIERVEGNIRSLSIWLDKIKKGG